MAAINGEGEKGKEAIAAAVIDLFRNIDKRQPAQPQLTDPQIHFIANLAEFCVRARTHVPRNGSNKEIVCMPEPEASPRLGQQFAQLTRGSALLDGRISVNSTDLALVKRVAFDSVRKDRRDILEALWRGHKAVSGSDLARITRLPQSTVSRRLEELRGMELVDVIEDDGVVGGLAKLSDLALSFL
jgi:DNA-binding transcriptional ArsR family regulator